MSATQSQELAFLHYELYAKHRDTPTHVEGDFLDRKTPTPPYWLYLRVLMILQTIIGWLRIDGFKVDVEQQFYLTTDTGFDDVVEDRELFLDLALLGENHHVSFYFYDDGRILRKIQINRMFTLKDKNELTTSAVELASELYPYFYSFMSQMEGHRGRSPETLDSLLEWLTHNDLYTNKRVV